MGAKRPQEAPSKEGLAAGEKDSKSNWGKFKRKAVQLLGGLIMEKKDGDYVISIGRVAWWLAFVPAVAIWIASGGNLDAGEAVKDISPNHFNMLMTLAGYNFGKKAVDLAGKLLGKSDGPG